MKHLSLLEWYSVAITHLMAWPSTRYWLFYRKVRWKDGETGKALFNKAQSLAVLLLISLVGFWWPFPGFGVLYAAGLTYLTIAVWYQYRVMRRLVRHRQERDEILARHKLEEDSPCSGDPSPTT